jgi:L,D-peptidoglycan transpeptidase YkuD (ErfK/YbiS/YcfS/YnhG family)/predicted deacylase
LAIGDWRVPCVVGQGGLVAPDLKREGDKATPTGVFALRYGFVDRAGWPDFPRDLAFPFVDWQPTLHWEEAPESPDYNRLLHLDPDAQDPDRLATRRAHGLFDLFVPIGWNDATPRAHAGSAIYLHIARPEMTGTAGCVAVARGDMAELARRLVPAMVIDIAVGDPPATGTPVMVATATPSAPAVIRPSPIEVVAFQSTTPGRRLLVTGAVHGNETCGPTAIARVIGEMRSGRIDLARGAVTFVPVVNRMAFLANRREGDRNLNRDLREFPVPTDHEDRVANQLVPILRRHEALLDLHSFRSAGEPFVFVGPRDNDGPIEPFRLEAEETAFAGALGVELAMHGWLTVYAKAVEERRRLIAAGVAASGGLPAGASAGVGTTEYLRSVGGFGVTLECGNHLDPAAPMVAYRAILAALAHFDMIAAPRPTPSLTRDIELVDVVLAHAADDRLVRSFATGDRVAAGESIARRASGEILAAPTDGFVVFPNATPTPLGEFYYFGVASGRFSPAR